MLHLSNKLTHFRVAAEPINETPHRNGGLAYLPHNDRRSPKYSPSTSTPKMPSNHHPLLVTDHYLRHLLLGFSSFIVLCSAKAAQLTQQSMSMRGCSYTDEEVHQLLQCLIEYRRESGQACSFSVALFSHVANILSTQRTASSLQTKFFTVRCNTCLCSYIDHSKIPAAQAGVRCDSGLYLCIWTRIVV